MGSVSLWNGYTSNVSNSNWTNKLFLGDNLEIIREHCADESVDLIYLDPPFNSNQRYNLLFKESTGEQSAAQILAFDDTWRWSIESEIAYRDVVEEGPRELSDFMVAARGFLGTSNMMAYLAMMAPRLLELHRVLKPTGSLFLHCDPTASHYLRMLLDAIFSPINFVNEISWRRTSAHSDAKRMGRVRDEILYYAKNGGTQTWNQVYQPYSREYLETHYRRETDDGRRYRTDNLTATGLAGGGYEYEWNGVERVWRCPVETMQRHHDEGRIHYTSNGVAEYIRYLDEMPGMPINDSWDDIKPINSQARERLGYPTQKPESLLERILTIASNEGDVVLDPFCGCGTTLAVAEKLKRRWMGIDITHLAVSLMKSRLVESFGDDLSPYDMIGVPRDLESARALATQSEHDGRYQFEYWALGLVGARPSRGTRRGADSGIDGFINFYDDNRGRPKRVVVQVKSGHVRREQIAALRGDMAREKAEIGLFITLAPPTRAMLTEAATAGVYVPKHFPNHRFPRLQILTVEDLLNGSEPSIPRFAPQATFKRAPRHRRNELRDQGALYAA